MAIEVPLGVLNVVDFGADPTGVKDSLPAINRALAWRNVNINTDQGIIFFPRGTYTVSGPIDFLPPKDTGTGLGTTLSGGEGGISFCGCGTASQIIGDFDDYVFKRYAPTYNNYGGDGTITIEDLSISNPHSTSTSGGILITTHLGVAIRNCTVTVGGGNGIVGNNGEDPQNPGNFIVIFTLSVTNCVVTGGGKASTGGSNTGGVGIGTSQGFSGRGNIVSGFAYGYKTTGHGHLFIGGITKLCTTGILLNQSTIPSTSGANAGVNISGMVFTDNDTSIDGASHGFVNDTWQGLCITSTDGHGVNGITLASGGGTRGGFQEIYINGSFSGYAVNAPFASSQISVYRLFENVVATNTASSARNWLISALPYGNGFSQCNNPDTNFRFVDLPNGNTFAPRQIGTEYSITNCNIAPAGNFGATAAAGGSNYAKVRWDGSNWVIC